MGEEGKRMADTGGRGGAGVSALLLPLHRGDAHSSLYAPRCCGGGGVPRGIQTAMTTSAWKYQIEGGGGYWRECYRCGLGILKFETGHD